MQTTLNEYKTLSDAYDFFNHKLFAGELPDCLITLQRKSAARGYFHPQKFASRTGGGNIDEIALNPDTFRERSDMEILSTLAHEMAHLWDEHFGHPARGSYHGKVWARKMKDIGLQPSTTGAPGGKETGQSVTHYIPENSIFATVCGQFLAHGAGLSWNSKQDPKKESKKSSKTKYTWPDCGQNAWAKPESHLMCGDCQCDLEEEA